MSTPVNCATSCCPEVENTQTPGPEGADGTAGTNGSDGASAFTLTTALVSIATVGDPYVLPVANNSTFAIGQPIFVSDGTDFATFVITAKTGTTSITGTFIGASGDTVPPFDLGSGSLVVPTGTEPVFVGLPTAFTDASGGTPSDAIAATVGIYNLAIAIQLASMTAAAADLVNVTPGHAFEILFFSATVTTIGVGAGAAQSLNLEINGTNVTGGVINLTEGNTTPLGTPISSSAISALNTGTAANVLTIEVAAGGTVFTAGEVILFLRVQNLDDTNAFASLAAHVDDLIVALT